MKHVIIQRSKTFRALICERNKTFVLNPEFVFCLLVRTARFQDVATYPKQHSGWVTPIPKLTILTNLHDLLFHHNPQTKNLGMTAPINTEEPKPQDIELTLALEVL